jgi:hypothetical protein
MTDDARPDLSTLSELIQRSQQLKEEAARLLDASQSLDEKIKEALNSSIRRDQQDCD